MNQVYRQRLLILSGIIHLEPERYRQTYWAYGDGRCVGGHAIDLFGPAGIEWGISGHPFAPKGELPEYEPKNNYDVFVKRVGEIVDLDFGDSPREGEVEYRQIDAGRLAGDLLGLTKEQGDALFFAGNSVDDVDRIMGGIIRGEGVAHHPECECGRCCDARDAGVEENLLRACDCLYCSREY